ncbi:DNA-binding protein [Methylorubrum thiocyanatum]|uniref:DNA-binding protein n=1 Tax=Methylorubrum thiocyanatum TaxID=47958 RepID=UPI00365C8C95
MKQNATPLVGANGSGLSEDPVIVGAENIALVIYGEIEGKREGNIRRIYHAISKKELPTFKLGGRVHARRSTIERWIEQQESAA